jgi:hypothetical protein
VSIKGQELSAQDGAELPRRSYNDLTSTERRAVDTLVRLGKRWPPTLRLFAWAGTLVIEDLERSQQDGRIRTIDDVPRITILCDGGDPDEAL